MSVNSRSVLFVPGPFIIFLLMMALCVPMAGAQEKDAAQRMFSRSLRAGSWIVTCDALENGRQESCVMEQKLTNPQGETVMVVNIGKAKNSRQKKAGFILPFGVHIPSGVWVTVDDGRKKYIVDLITCLKSGFVGELVVGSELQKKFAKGKQAVVTITSTSGRKELHIPFSLSDFKKAFAAIK